MVADTWCLKKDVDILTILQHANLLRFETFEGAPYLTVVPEGMFTFVVLVCLQFPRGFLAGCPEAVGRLLQPVSRERGEGDVTWNE